ncbi:MAG TPA: hypothetical protein PLN38_13850 [Chitinophagales bacterium]|jgi:hypothetical protein|nr:hypothetical protein [Chitinophagales bacterium]
MKIIGEKLFQIMPKDLIKGFIVAILSVLVTYTGQALEKGTLPMDAATWILQLKIAVGAGIAYIIKNWLTNSDDKFLKAEPKTEDAK